MDHLVDWVLVVMRSCEQRGLPHALGVVYVAESLSADERLEAERFRSASTVVDETEEWRSVIIRG